MSTPKKMEINNDLVSACKNKLSQFRVKELKDVLCQVGHSKQGKKQDLLDRILALLYDEGTPGLFKNSFNGKDGLVEIINETYRNMHGTTSNDSNAKKHNTSGSSRLRPKEEADDTQQLERKIRCPCGSDSTSGAALIQCLDPDCNVWQHSGCVIIPERPMEKICMPTHFLCEICRVNRADPFWATVAQSLYPVKLAASTIPVDGTNPHVRMEKTFKLTRADRDLMQRPEFDVQVWCLLFNDIVPFRMQWPQYADLQVNGIPVKTVNRPGAQRLGANGRDDGAKITSYAVEGVNKISMSFADARTFCFGVRLVRRRPLEQVFGMIPKEPDGEHFTDALARVQRCIGGGIATGHDDSDSDLEVIADSVTVNLRCPMSGSRMKIAGRFRSCAHMGCFDLETFVGMNERSRKWQCPICLKNYSLEDVIVDPFFNRILNMMQSCGEEIHEIDMRPDGTWRVKNARELGDLVKWHHPDGSVEDFTKSENGQEYVGECNTSKPLVNQHVDVPQGMRHSLTNQRNEVENDELHIITMSSTTTEGKDDGDPSINQDGDEQFGASSGNGPEISSDFNQFSQTHVANGQRSSLPAEHADIIVLSDSEDDDVSLIYPESIPLVYPPKHEVFSATEKILESCFDDPSNDDAGIITRNNGDHLMSQSPFRSTSPGVSGFDLFGTSGPLVDDHNSATCYGPVNCMLVSETTVDPIPHVMDSYDPHNSSFDNQIPSFNRHTTSEGLLPCLSVSGNELPLLNRIPGDDWASVETVGNGHQSSSVNVEAHRESADEYLLDLQNQHRSKEESLIQRTYGDSGSGSGFASGSDVAITRKRSGGPFSFPRQQRSARRRLYREASSDCISK